MSKDKRRRKKTLSRKQLELALQKSLEVQIELAKEIVELKVAIQRQNEANAVQDMQDKSVDERLRLVEQNVLSIAKEVHAISGEIMSDGCVISGKAIVKAIQREALTLETSKIGKFSSRNRKMVLDVVSGKLHFKD